MKLIGNDKNNLLNRNVIEFKICIINTKNTVIFKSKSMKTKVLVWGHEFGSNEHIGSICDPTIFSDRCRG